MPRPKQSILAKLLIGNVSRLPQSKYNPIQKRILNIKAIWNNDHQDDNGIEKIIRLLLSFSQMLFPGIYIKYLASKIGNEYEDLALDLYLSKSYFSSTFDCLCMASISCAYLDINLPFTRNHYIFQH